MKTAICQVIARPEWMKKTTKYARLIDFDGWKDNISGFDILYIRDSVGDEEIQSDEAGDNLACTEYRNLTDLKVDEGDAYKPQKSPSVN